jgi:branched-chain amino acid transport system permease protein
MVFGIPVADIIIIGLAQGAIFALLGIGLTIILGTMDFLNLAHGALYLIGAYTGLIFFETTELNDGLLFGDGYTVVGFDGGFLLAFLMVPVIGVVVGALMERYVAEPFYDRPETDQLLVTFGLALVVQELIKQLFGGRQFDAISPTEVFGVGVSGPIAIPFLGTFPRWRLVIIGITVALIAVTYVIIERTDFGLVVQAGTVDAEMVRLLGIRISRSYGIVFALGAALAALAGFIGVTFQSIRPQIGTERALIPAFLTIVVGGAGNVLGAIVGGMILGIVLAGMQQLFSQWAQIAMYSVAAAVLLFKPEGILGSRGGD